MAERELAYSLAEMVMSTPPYRTMGQQHSIPVV
jgi:CPA2 family monovalent cation:H+ antiporter-2